MGRSDQWPSFTAAVLIMAIAHPTSSCSGLTRASPTSHPSLVFHDISVLCATTDARVKPEHDAERVTTCQNENCCQRFREQIFNKRNVAQVQPLRAARSVSSCLSRTIPSR